MRVDTINRSRARAIDTFVSIESGDRYTPTGDAVVGRRCLLPGPWSLARNQSLFPTP